MSPTTSSLPDRYDVVILGGGHNALAAAAYLARAGVRPLVLERLPHTGGAAVSAECFPGLPARLSRFSYLVSVLPERLVRDLGLGLELRSRSTASYSPVLRGERHQGLLVERPEGEATAESFRALTGTGEEYAAWQRFHSEVAGLAAVVAPTLLEPLPRERDLRSQLEEDTFRALVERPLGEVIEQRFGDDTVRGVVGTDALIGTFADLDSESLVQNKCFLYHVVGNGTGEWRVPVGGMGAVSTALERAAVSAGAHLLTGAEVTGVATDGATAEVSWHDGERDRSVRCSWVLSGVAPGVLHRLLGSQAPAPARPEGSQLKINLLVDRLPRLRSGADPRVAFAGTFHVGESYDGLHTAYAEAAAGRIPSTPPGELYCHSLTDPSILPEELARRGMHTLTYFGVHMPARLFEDDREARRDEAVRRVVAAIDEHLLDPLEDCLARDREGRPCLEAKVPQDVEEDLAMPGGHIFHGDLSWPWAPDRARLDTPARRWGVDTDLTPAANVLLCGSGARRGGAVSALGGHNAAHAVLESR